MAEEPNLTTPSTGAKSAWERYRYGTFLVAAVAGTALCEFYLFPGAPTTILVALLAIASAVETAQMVRAAGVDPFSRVSIPLAVLFVLGHALAHLQQSFTGTDSLPILRSFRTAELALLTFGLYCCACVLRQQTKDAAAVLGGGALVFLVPASLLYIVDIRFHASGPRNAGLALVVFLVAVSKVGDIAAYVVGTAIGRHKLIPAVSPGKSWEGAVASFLAACGTAAILGVVQLAGPLDARQAVIGGIVINVASQFGDLTESLLKRSAGVKDSGRWIPQFGGIFDLVDSLFLAAPMFYGFLKVTAP
jgi:phosphatidate cytidylyltransferase